MLIDPAGSVGIGTITPLEKLDVHEGEIQLSGGYGIDWEDNPGGGGSDDAWIRYLRDGAGENTELQIGIANDSDDNIAFYQLGQERMTLVDGRVGIGTTAPTQLLEVRGPIRSSDSNGGWEFYGGANLHIRDDGAERFYIQGSTGNVGIQTTAPTQELEIQSSNDEVALQLNSSGGQDFRIWGRTSDSRFGI